MATQRVMVVGGGLAGLACAMKLAELGVHVDLMSMVPVKRSHSVCAQGGINSVNNLTRQQGDNEHEHFFDTVYGGDFLQHQPLVKEMCDWGPKIIDLLDFGATVEPGKFIAFIDEFEQVRLSWDKLKAVLGAERTAYLRTRIRPVTVRPLRVEQR